MRRRSISGTHAEQEDSYFISMTDIMVGMLFMFIILLMYLAHQIGATREQEVVPKHKYDLVISQLNELEDIHNKLKRQHTDLEGRYDKLEALHKELIALLRLTDGGIRVERERVLTTLQQQIQTKTGTLAEINANLGILRFEGDSLFASGRSIYDADGRGEQLIRALAESMAEILPCYTKSGRVDALEDGAECPETNVRLETVFIEGHTDNVPIGRQLEAGVKDNLDLSVRRASNTYREIIDWRGVLSQLRNNAGFPLLSIAGYGEHRPINLNITEKDRAQNRRIDLRILMTTNEFKIDEWIKLNE